MRKGISAVIATILVLIITVGLAATAWMFVSGVFTARVSTAFSVIDTYANTIIIRNDGTVPITSFNSITVDESPATYLVTPLDRSMVGNWKFDEGAGNTAEDSSGYGNDGTLYNNPTWVDGKYGKALSFDGVDDHVRVPHSELLSNEVFGTSEVFTLEAWAYPRAWANWAAIINKANGGYWSHTTNGMWASDQNGFACVMGSNVAGNPGGSYIIVSYKPPLNNWYHIVCTADGIDLIMYVNGEEIGRKPISDLTYPRSSNTAPLVFGRRCVGCSPSFDGIIDEIRIYSRSLTEEEIKALYDIGGQINPGSMATIKIYDVLSKGTHAVRICTLTMCQSVYLTIY
jgi:hypothetical protein